MDIKIKKWLKQHHLIINNNHVMHTQMYIIYYIVMVFVFIKHVANCKKNINIITLHITSLYATFAEQILILNKVRYRKITTPYLNYQHYYLSNLKKMVHFNPTLEQFKNEVIDFIPLSNDDLDALEKHTQLKNLTLAQDKVLLLLPDINAYHVIRQKYIDNDDYDYHDDHHDDHHAIILTDYVYPLQAGDIINKSYFSETHQKIIHDEKYIVNADLQLEPLRKKLIDKDIVSLPFYNLKTPRDKIILHPFHLPDTQDPILAIMIVTQAIIDMIYYK
ncbi:MAG TPA: hypothetical protein VLG50_05545 [Candidatus Saccharimonadales bacterium]|nr:hypothetical protein [Candidatus Saccharimonadales bacterium]